MDGVYNVTVNVFDPSLGDDGTDTFPVTITATDVNEAPTVVLPRRRDGDVVDS